MERPPEQTFYSQHGEDFVLRTLFPDQNDGVFVEVGCIDGRRFSNTLHFEHCGWKGLCVEAHAGYIDLLHQNRPGSIIEHAAVGEEDAGEVEFYANSRGSLSTLDASQEERFKKYGRYFTGFEVQKVPKLTLSTLFARHVMREIQFLSLDIEGYEVEALRGIDLDRWRPEVFVIESDSPAHRKGIEAILLPAGYRFVTELARNVFYSLDPRHRSLVHGRTFRNVHLIHTQHPLDDQGDAHHDLTVTTGRSWPRRTMKKLRSFVRKRLGKRK